MSDPKKIRTDELVSLGNGIIPTKGHDRGITTTGEMRSSAGRVTELAERLREQIHRRNLEESERLRLEAFLEELREVPIPKDYTPENAQNLTGLIQRIQKELDVYQTRHRQAIDWLDLSIRKPGIINFPEFAIYREKIEHFLEELRRQKIILREAERSRVRHTIELIETAPNAAALRNLMSEFLTTLETSYEYHKKYPNAEFDKLTGNFTITGPDGLTLLREESGFFKNYKFQIDPYDPNHIKCLLEGGADALEISLDWTESKPEEPPFLTARIDKRDVIFSGPILSSPNSLTETIENYKQQIRETYNAYTTDDLNDPGESWEMSTEIENKNTGAHSTIEVQGSPEEKKRIQILSAFSEFYKIRETLSPTRKSKEDKEIPTKDKWQNDEEINQICERYEYDETKFLSELAKIPLQRSPYIVILKIENPLFSLQLSEEEIQKFLQETEAILYRNLHETKQFIYCQTSASTGADVPLAVPEKLLGNRPSLRAYIKYHRFEREKGMSAPILGELVIDSEEDISKRKSEQYWALNKSSYTIERKNSLVFFEQGWAEFDNQQKLEWTEQNGSLRRIDSPYVSIATISLSNGQEKRFILFQKTFSEPSEESEIMKTIRKLNGRIEHFFLKNTILEKRQRTQYKNISIDIERNLLPIESETLADHSTKITQKENAKEIPEHEFFLLQEGWSEITLPTLQQWLSPGNFFSLRDTSYHIEIISTQKANEALKYFIKLTKTKTAFKQIQQTLEQEFQIDSQVIRYDLFKTFQNEFESYATVPDTESPEFDFEHNLYLHLQGDRFAICPDVIYKKWMEYDEKSKKYGIEEYFSLWDPTHITFVTATPPNNPEKTIRLVRIERNPYTHQNTKNEILSAGYQVEDFCITKAQGLQKINETNQTPLQTIEEKATEEKATEEKLTVTKPTESKSWLNKKINWTKTGFVAAAVSIAAMIFPGLKQKTSETVDNATSKLGDTLKDFDRTQRIFSQGYPSSRFQQQTPQEPLHVVVQDNFRSAPASEAASKDAGVADARTYKINLENTNGASPDAFAQYIKTLDAGLQDADITDTAISPDASTYTIKLTAATENTPGIVRDFEKKHFGGLQPEETQKKIKPSSTTVEKIATPEKNTEHWVTIGVEGNAISTAVINDITEKYRQTEKPTKKQFEDYKKKITKIVSRFVIHNNIPWNVFHGDTVQYDYSEENDGNITINSIEYHKKDAKIEKPSKTPELTFDPIQIPPRENPQITQEESSPEAENTSSFSLGGQTFTPGEIIEYLPTGSQPKKYTVIGTTQDKSKLVLQSLENPKKPPIIINKESIDTRIPEKGNETFTIDGLWIEKLFGDAFNIRFSEASGKGVIKALATLILAIDYNNEKAKWGFALLDANKAVAKANTLKHIPDTYDMTEYSKISNRIFSTDSFVAKKQDGVWEIESAHFSQGEKHKIKATP